MQNTVHGAENVKMVKVFRVSGTVLEGLPFTVWRARTGNLPTFSYFRDTCHRKRGQSLVAGGSATRIAGVNVFLKAPRRESVFSALHSGVCNSYALDLCRWASGVLVILEIISEPLSALAGYCPGSSRSPLFPEAVLKQAVVTREHRLPSGAER